MKRNTSILTLVVATIGAAMAGFVLGAILGRYIVQLISMLWTMIDRRDRTDEERLKFELLLQ